MIAACGTIGLELLRQHGTASRLLTGRAPTAARTKPTALDAVFVSVGGGSLLAGIAATLKATSPATKIIAVEPRAADVLSASLLCGKPISGADPGPDGIFVSQIGPEVFRLCDVLVGTRVYSYTPRRHMPAPAHACAGTRPARTCLRPRAVRGRCVMDALRASQMT